MEAMEGMMRRMKLSAAEKKGIKVAEMDGGGAGSAAPMAIGKVLSEKLVHAEGLTTALGRI